MTVNFFDKEKADELMKLGFHYITQRAGDGKEVYVFTNSPQLNKIIASKFSKNDFYFGKTLNF